MSSMKKMGAMESMFDPEQTAAELLETVKANVANTVKTIDAAASLENKLSEEAAQFNACLTTMSNAIRKCERGEISREEMLAECAPCVAALKEKCSALKLGDVKTTGDDITEEEIAMLREYIVGCKDIVADRKKELQDCPVACASEGLMAALSNFEPATEATTATEIRKSTEAKTANELYKQAKKLYGLGSKEKALEYLKKAQKLYENCLKKAEKAGNMIEATRTEKVTAVSIGIGASNQLEYKDKVTKNQSIPYVIEYFEDRIDACKALEMQWNNKAGKSTYAETKAQLKAERKQIKHENRLEKAKAAAGKKAGKAIDKSAKKFADKAYKEKLAAAKSDEEREAVESAFECMIATEAFAEELLTDYDLAFALESEGEEAEAPAVSEAEQKLRDLYAQFNEAKAEGDEDKMNQLVGEINKVIAEVEKEAADAYTEDDLKAADRKMAKALAIGAAVVSTVAAIAYGIKSGTFQKVAEKAKEQSAKLKENKGEKKSETSKAKSILGNIMTALSGLKGKIKIGKKTKVEESMIDGMTCEEFEASMESYMDSLELELAIGAAMEAEGADDESSTKSASGLGSKIRAAFGKFKKAKKEGNSSEMSEAEKEVKETVDEIIDAAESAETPEEKKKWNKVVNIALAVMATIALLFLGKKAAEKFKAAAQSNGGDKWKTLKDIVNEFFSAVKHEASVTKDTAVYAANRTGKKIQGIFKKKTTESFLGALCDEYALESFIEDVEEEEVEPAEGKAFDADAQGSDMIDDANESELDALATEAAIAVMLAEDGIDDSDLI